MKIPNPITAEHVPTIRALAVKYGVTWKSTGHTDESPKLTEKMSALLSEFDAEIAFQAARQCAELPEARDMAAKITTQQNDERNCGLLWRGRQQEIFHQRRERRMAGELRRLEIGPWANLTAVLPLLYRPLDAASCYTSLIARATDAAPDAEKTGLPELAEYGDDPLEVSSCAANWTTLAVPAYRFGADHLCRHTQPGLGNLSKHWTEFRTRYGVDGAFAHCSIGADTATREWRARITFSANSDVCWILDGMCQSPPTRNLILLACFAALIESGYLGNPCLDNPRSLDARENYDQCDGML